MKILVYSTKRYIGTTKYILELSLFLNDFYSAEIKLSYKR